MSEQVFNNSDALDFSVPWISDETVVTSHDESAVEFESGAEFQEIQSGEGGYAHDIA